MVINETVIIVLFFAILINAITTVTLAMAVVVVSIAYMKGFKNERERQWLK